MLVMLCHLPEATQNQQICCWVDSSQCWQKRLSKTRLLKSMGRNLAKRLYLFQCLQALYDASVKGLRHVRPSASG